MTAAVFHNLKNDPAGNLLPLSPFPRFRRFSTPNRQFAKFVVFVLFVALFAFQATAQNPPPPPPPPPPAVPTAPPTPPPGQTLTSKQLENLVSRIALYPDPLLAQILTASTFWTEIPQAASWANDHSNLKGDALAAAIRADNLQLDPSVLALLPFPSVLNMMAQDPSWTEQLGNAVLNQRPEVMDAVQRLRKQARKYGYLRANPYCTVVDSGGYVEILPVNPAYIYVPVYDPLVVFAPPRPGFVIGGAIGWNPAVVITAGFFPWGWSLPHFAWGAHAIILDETPWNRVWLNRGYYIHSYAHPWVPRVGPRVEIHPVPPR